jgi:hypothetical protein
MENLDKISENKADVDKEKKEDEEEIDRGLSINNLSLSSYFLPDRGNCFSVEKTDKKNEQLALKVSSVLKMSNKPFHLSKDFEESILKPASTSDITNIENYEETVITKDGSTNTHYKSEKEVVGACPQLGTDKAFGRQTHETVEQSNDKYRYLTDDKTETVTDQQGNRITRTIKSANVQYSTGNRISASSILNKNESKNRIPSTSFFDRSNTKQINSKQNKSLISPSENEITNIGNRLSNLFYKTECSESNENKNDKIIEDAENIKFRNFKEISCENSNNESLANFYEKDNLGKSSDNFSLENKNPSSNNRQNLISYNEDLEESFLNGTKSKIYRSVKDIVGFCPELSSEQAFGQQTRETKEKVNDKLYSLTDDKTEVIEDNFGNKITRKTKSSNIKYSNNNQPCVTSFFENSNNTSTNNFQKINQQFENNLLISVPELERNKSANFCQDSQNKTSNLGSIQSFSNIENTMKSSDEKQLKTLKDMFTSITNENKYRYNVIEKENDMSKFETCKDQTFKDISDREIVHENKSSRSQFSGPSLFQQTNIKYLNSNKKTDNFFLLNQHVPVFYPYPSLQINQPDISNFTSNLLTTTSFYPINHNVNRSIFPLPSQKSYISDENYGVMSQIRSTPTIKEIVPPTFSIEIENTTVKKGGPAFFKGTVNGSFPFETIWYIDNYEIKPNDHIETSIRQDNTETFLTGLIDFIISLKINNCSISDIGKYTAYVKNEAGDASCSAFLIIEGKNKLIWNMCKNSLMTLKLNLKSKIAIN